MAKKNKRKLPADARCYLCNHYAVFDGFGSCWRGNHMQDGQYRYKSENDVCWNFSRNLFIKDNKHEPSES